MSAFLKNILILQLLTVTSPFKIVQLKPGALLLNLKFWFSNNGTVSKFPPILEYIVQRIQTQNSNYVHEDLSRPPTWEKPVYTLSPSEQLTAYQPLPVENVTEAMGNQIAEDAAQSTTESKFEYEATEKFLETSTNATISETKPTTEDKFEYEELEETSERFFETNAETTTEDKFEYEELEESSEKFFEVITEDAAETATVHAITATP